MHFYKARTVLYKITRYPSTDHISPHYTPFHNIPLYSTIFHHVLVRLIPSSYVAFASKSLGNALLRHITTGSTPVHNIALHTPALDHVLSRSLLQKKAPLFSDAIRNHLLGHITSHCTAFPTLHFILLHSTVFFCVHFLQRRFVSLPIHLGWSIALHQIPFHSILQDSTKFQHVISQSFLSNKALFLSKTFMNPLLRHIMHHSSPFNNIALHS